ncbi:hypothetical protein [Vibrio harveyi]|uniref:hypothetical protein n=1 Tax=Vibrio harveyi TaxID=669 RepID=UPI003BB53A96
MRLTRLRTSATKGSHPIIAPVIIDKERFYIDRWLELRGKHRVRLIYGKRQERYRGLDPDSPVFMSNHHGEWKPFSERKKQ